MVLGNGAIASLIKDREDIVFFACGVSNSQETDEKEYQREKDLLQKQDRATHIVYFSSMSIFDKESRYTKHKREMESIVKTFDTYTIIRLGNITWGNNPNTFLNFFKNNPNTPVFDEYRYMVEQDEFEYWLNKIPKWSCEINIVGKRLKVKDALKCYL